MAIKNRNSSTNIKKSSVSDKFKNFRKKSFKTGKGIKKAENKIKTLSANENQDTLDSIEQVSATSVSFVKKSAKKAKEIAVKATTKVAKYILKIFKNIFSALAKAIGPIGMLILILVIVIGVGVSVLFTKSPVIATENIKTAEDVEKARKQADFQAIYELAQDHKKKIEKIVDDNPHDNLVLPTGYGIPNLHLLYMQMNYYPVQGSFKVILDKYYENLVSIETLINTRQVESGNAGETTNYTTLTITTKMDTDSLLDTKGMLTDKELNNVKDVIYKIAGVKATGNNLNFVYRNIEATMWFYLLENGFTKEATAGIMGNVYAESGFKTDTIEQTSTNPGEGVGLFQWSFDRKSQFLNYAETQGKSWTDLGVQLNFLLYELETSQTYRFNTRSLPYPSPFNYFGLAGGIEEFKTLTDINHATQVFCWNFLSPNFNLANYSTRENKAKEYYDKYKDFNQADLAGYEYDDETIQQLFNEAEKHIGKPYVYGANGPDAFDCSSFACWAYTQSSVAYMPRTTAHNMYTQYCNPISEEEAKAGDLIFFEGTYASSQTISHVGIYAGDGLMLHAGNPIAYENINQQYWQDHFYAFGRPK